MSRKKKNNNKIETIIGILLFMPIYILVFVMFNIFRLHGIHDYVLLPILLYVPIIVGLIIAYVTNKKEFNILTGILILISCLIAVYFFHETYFVENQGWRSVSEYLLWLINTGICRIITLIFYGKYAGWKKSFIMFGIYAILIILSFLLGFWA